MNQYLDFVQHSDSGKTKVFSVDSRRHGQRLAVIKWWGAWRQYVMFPEPETVWNVDCLQEIRTFIAGLMDERKAVDQSMAEKA